jgi:ABC-type nickel/cobalt efflux system permease component RcnA
MPVAGITFAGAFLVGLAHTLEPCEDKAIVSFFVLGLSRSLKQALSLVILYGLGMACVDTILGLLASYLGVSFLHSYHLPLELAAGAITIGFGALMLAGAGHLHLGHHHGLVPASQGNPRLASPLSLFGFGLIRGLPPCPVELGVLLWAASVGSVLQGTLLVFVFGIGTTIGLIPLALVMGGLTKLISKTRYQQLMPRLVALAMIATGVAIMLAPFLGFEF